MTRRKPARKSPNESGQLDLFAGDPVHAPSAEASRHRAVDPAEFSHRHRDLAARLPGALRMGTSSWSFPGWNGMVYGGNYSKSRLARDGLAAYAQHPLFRTVGVDRTHYAPVPAEVFARYADQVPDDFRFLVKAHELCTLARVPSHSRYGSKRGQRNHLFLDPTYATDVVVGPLSSGLGQKSGPILFQLAPQPMELFGSPKRFADRLYRFLTALPRGLLYAVEIRNASLMSEAYAAALTAAGACHCINLLGAMPPPLVQWDRVVGHRAPALVIRWMLIRHMRYDQALEAYEPFDRLVDPDLAARDSIAALVRMACALEMPSYVIVNNKAEGSAPLSVSALAAELWQT